ncbi:protein containg PAS domain S-box [Longilinea arvoryzae]|uniref:Protein containg PAS domain S-box n=1 Tax=Longilinea arvoryzae TaxID=360412 RepID=A0A0S7BJ19_9CHLR|nr:HD domain-containing phosphohydrolase [Longilinea arvoryzae]GAP14579.1 protein containg PAS domain S-box [Longilinea arvoryzae]
MKWHRQKSNSDASIRPSSQLFEAGGKPGSLLQAMTRLFTLRLFIPALLLVIALIGLCGYLYASRIEHEQIQVAQTIAARTDDFLQNAGQSLNAWAVIIDKTRDESLSEYLSTQSFFDTVYLVDRQGTILKSASNTGVQATTELLEQGIGQGTSFSRDVQISQPFVSAQTGLLTVFLSKSLADGNTIIGELNLSGLQQSILTLQSTARDGQLFFISDGEGTIVTDSLSEQAAQRASLSYFRAWKEPGLWPASRQIVNTDNLAIETQTPLKNAKWMVSAEFPLSSAFTSYLWIVLGALTVILALWATLVYNLNQKGIQRIITPLVELSQSTRQLTEEGSSQLPALISKTAPYTEIRDLAANFERMYTSLQTRQAAVQESEQKYRMLIEQSSDAIYVEHRGHFVITNQKFNEMFGLGRDDKEITSLGFIQFVSPASRPLVRDIQKQVTNGQANSLRYEFSAKAKDGHEIELEASTSALPYMDGVAIQSIVRDITERKRTEQAELEQRILAEALRDSVSALNNTLEVDEVIDHIFSNASKVVPFQAATIMLLDETPKLQARVVASFGYQRHTSQDRPHKQNFALDEFLNLKRMYDSGRPLVIPDTLHSNFRTASPEIRWVRSYAGSPIRVHGDVIGFLNLEVDIPNFYNQTHADRLQAFADQAGVAIHNAQLLTDLRKSRDELYNAYETTLEGWSKALELRDYETEGHTQRVMDMTMKLAESYGITGPELLHFRYGTLLHDIGKIGIPDSILFKPGPLNDEEWEVMRRHPMYAQRILAHIPYLQDSLDIPYYHHEKWDGTGYPRGLKGEEIPLSARLFAVVDVWDGLRSNRHYRSGWPEAEVIQYIQDQSGKHFDPKVVDVFLRLLEEQNRTICLQ